MTKRLLAAALLTALVLTGCGDDGRGPSDGGSGGHRLYVEHIGIGNNIYTCIVYDDDRYEQGGLWCERQDA